MNLMLIGRIEKVEAPKEAKANGQEWWYVECAAAGAWTQAHSRKHARLMLVDWFETCVNRLVFKATATEIGRSGNGFAILIDANQRQHLMSRVLVYQRWKHKLSRETVAKRAGLSGDTYTAYEEGRAIPSLDTLGALLEIVAPEFALMMGPRVVPANKAPKRRRVVRRRRRAA